MFFYHSGAPIGVGQGATVGLRDGRQGGGVEDGPSRHPVATLGARRHGVLVAHRSDSHGALGQGSWASCDG